MVVGYGPSKRGKVRAIIISEGQLKEVGLKDIELEELPPELKAMPEQSSVIKLKRA